MRLFGLRNAPHLCCVTMVLALSIGLLTPASNAQSRPKRDRSTQENSLVQEQLDQAMRERLGEIIRPGGEPLTAQQFAGALSETDALLAQAAWYIDESNAELFRELSRTARLLRLMVDGRQTKNGQLWTMLEDHPALAEAVAFALQDGRDSLPDAMLVLDSLRKQFGADRLAAFANLTAAVCVVHDRPRTPPGRQPTTGASANELWAYFAGNERNMQLGIRSMPVDLLAHLVDSSASIAEMQWALSRYGRDAQVGNRYSEISYDDNAFQTGAPKRIDALPYTLQNIRQVGGVCSEQAYFAAHVGKAIGIPTIELTAIGSVSGHAWLGYLRVRGRQAAWDFDTGCYEEYKQYVGKFRDPLSGQQYEEGHAAFLSTMIGVKDETVYRAVAMHDATRALAKFTADADAPVITFDTGTETSLAPVRSPDPSGISALLTASFVQAGAERRIWELACDLASQQRIAGKELEATFSYLERLCGRNEIGYFALTAPKLLWGIEDIRVQSRLYDRVARAVRQKPEYAANVRYTQGDGLSERSLYEEALRTYLLPTQGRNLDGPWTVTAVDRVTQLLRTTNKQEHLADLIGDIFRNIPRPSTEGAHQFRAGSVWGQVGERYHRALVMSGRTREAQDLRRQLDTIVRRIDVPIR
jgi:hypothetical protein